MEHPAGAANDAHQLRGMKKRPDRGQPPPIRALTERMRSVRLPNA